MAVDFDPSMISYWQKKKLPAQYGDMEDPVLPGHLCYPGRIAVTAHRASDALLLQEENEHVLVLLPFSDAAETVASKLFNTAGSGMAQKTERWQKKPGPLLPPPFA